MKKNLFFTMLIMVSITLMPFVSMGKTPSLKDAVNAQDAAKVKELLAAGADANEKISGFPVLFWATAWSNCEIIKMLLDAGAQVNAVGGAGKEPALAALAEAYEPDSAVRKNIAANESLIKRVKGDTAKVAKWLAHTDITRFSTVYDRAKLLLSYGADPNLVTVFNSPFLMCVVKMQKPAIKAMLESGKVNIDQCYFSIDMDIRKATKDWVIVPDQMSPLMFVVGKGDLELVKLFVEAGADVNVTKVFKDKSVNALFMAAANGYTEIVEYLKSKSSQNTANVNNGLEPGTYCVAFVLEKVSSGLGSRSVDYACIYIQVQSSKKATQDELVEVARNYRISQFGNSSNGYQNEKQAFFFDKACTDCKTTVESFYQLSDFRVEYTTY